MWLHLQTLQCFICHYRNLGYRHNARCIISGFCSVLVANLKEEIEEYMQFFPVSARTFSPMSVPN